MVRSSQAVLLTVALVLFPRITAVAEVYVDVDATGANNGASWTDAYTSLSEALSNATEEIWVAEGTYTPGTTSADVFLITTNPIYGGFDGTESSRSERDWQTHETILSGNLGATNAIHVVKTDDSPPMLRIIDGFTIRDGHADGTSYGGLYCVGETMVANCAFVSNTATIHGGAMGCYSDVSTIVSNCTFTANSAGEYGGAIRIGNTAYGLTVIDSRFFNNYAGWYGAGVYFSSASLLSVSDSVFIGNVSQYRAGGIYWDMGAVGKTNTISDCVFTDNTTTNSSQGGGGAIYGDGANAVVISGCAFTNSATETIGGAVYLDPSDDIFITNCTFAGSSSASLNPGGGAIFLNDDPGNPRVTMADCLFTNNTSSWGGGGVFTERPITTERCQYLGNSSASYGGAFFAQTGSASETNNIIDCVFRDNQSKHGGAVYMYYGGTDSQTDLVRGSCFVGNQATNTAGNGGAMASYSTRHLIVESCAFTNNSCARNDLSGGGGAIFAYRSMTLTNSSLTGNSVVGRGGGVYASHTSSVLTVDGCTFTSNSAAIYNGGAIDSANLLRIRNSVFVDNSAGSSGGGTYQAYVSGASTQTNEFAGNTFNGNSASNLAGAAYFNSTRMLAIEFCGFTNNYTVDGHGGAVSITRHAASIAVSNCFFAANVAGKNTTNWPTAGAIYVEGESASPSPAIEVLGCTFDGNSSSNHRCGALYSDHRPVRVTDSRFTDNSAASDGGAFLAYDIPSGGDASDLANCVFAGNEANNGGAAFIWLKATNSEFTIRNCTFYTNRTAQSGGAVMIEMGTVNLTSSIFRHNVANAGSNDSDDIYVDPDDTLNIGYCCIDTNEIEEDGTVNYGDGIINTNPLFASVASYDFHLMSKKGRWTPGGWVTDAAHSPCIDAGDPVSLYTTEPKPNGERVNMGAYGNSSQASKAKYAKGMVLLVK